MNNGFVYVATCLKVFYEGAVFGANSLRDYYPDAKITLFTHEQWVDKRADVFDNVITEGVPERERAKMWGMARTPYDKTLYLDADTEIWHHDIQNVFDLLDDDHDMALTKTRDYSAVITKFPGGNLKWHCGVALYNNKPDTLQFMQDWYDLYNKQEQMRVNKEWDLDDKLYPREKLWLWDTFTFWRLLHLEGYNEKLKIQGIKDDARWNFHNYKLEELDQIGSKEIIIYHHSLRSNWAIEQ